MNYEILNITDTEKVANYDKLVEENNILKEQRSYYKMEYDLITIKLNEKNREINRLIKEKRKLEKLLMEVK